MPNYFSEVLTELNTVFRARANAIHGGDDRQRNASGNKAEVERNQSNHVAHFVRFGAWSGLAPMILSAG